MVKFLPLPAVCSYYVVMKGKIIASIIAAALLLCAGALLGRRTAPIRIETKTEIIYDTITRTGVRRDTVFQTKVVYRELPVVRRDTITIRDTVKVAVPISRHIFSEEGLYYAEVDGFEVDMHKIEVFPRTIRESVIERKPSRFSVGVQVGYGANVSNGTIRAAPYIGIGIQYNLWNF